MALDVALTLRYAREGETKMLEETAAGIGKVDQAAKGAGSSVGGLAEGMRETATEAPKAATGVEGLGQKAKSAGGSFDNLKTLGIAAIGGIAGAIVAAGLDLAFNAAIGAVTDYIDTVTNSAKNIQDDLTGHGELIRNIKGMWAEAEGAASSYGLKSNDVLLFESQQNIARLGEDLAASTSRIDRGFIERAIGSTYAGGGTFAALPLNDVLAGFLADLEDGKADIIAWRDEVTKILATLPTDSPFRTWGEEFLTRTAEAAEVQASLEQAVDLFKALTGDAQAAATAMGSSAAEMAATGTAAEGALPALREYEVLLGAISQVTVTLPDGSTVSGNPGTIGGSFAEGGYTGHLPTDRVAGFVHGQEYVFDAAATRAIGVDNLDAIRRGVRGYASGGAVGGAVAGLASGDRGWFGLAGDLNAARGAIRGFAEELWETRSPMAALASAVKSASQSYVNRAIGAVGNLVEDLIFGEVPRYAMGTSSHPGGWAMVGESGPELVNLPRGAAVVPHQRSMAMLGGGTVNNFFVETPSPRAFAESRSSVARAAGRLAAASQRHS